MLDRLLHRAAVVGIDGPSYRQPPRNPAARVQDPLVPTAVRNCPHCDQPVAIVALLATAEAARPTITQPSSEVIALRRG